MDDDKELLAWQQGHREGMNYGYDLGFREGKEVGLNLNKNECLKKMEQLNIREKRWNALLREEVSKIKDELEMQYRKRFSKLEDDYLKIIELVETQYQEPHIPDPYSCITQEFKKGFHKAINGIRMLLNVRGTRDV